MLQTKWKNVVEINLEMVDESVQINDKNTSTDGVVAAMELYGLLSC